MAQPYSKFIKIILITSLVLFVLVVAIFVILAITSCTTQDQQQEPVISPGLITCWDPASGEVVLRREVDNFDFNLHQDSTLNADMDQGLVRITGNYVKTYDNGTTVYLINHPCRLVYDE